MLSFEAESVDFSLTRDPGTGNPLWQVDGVYSFSNLSSQPVSQAILFPVPSDSTVSEPYDLRLEWITPGDSLALFRDAITPNGFRFRLGMPARSFAQLRIAYKQVLYGNEASYILTSANQWGRPLPSAGFTLFIQAGMEVPEPPFPDPRAVSTDLGTILSWEFLGFRPEGEFVARFR
jgi:hypothetical protein